MRIYMLLLFLFTNLHNNLQGVQDDQVGLGCKISIDECFMLQLCSGPTMKGTEGLIKLVSLIYPFFSRGVGSWEL